MRYNFFLFFLLIATNVFADKLQINFYEPKSITQKFDTKISLIDTSGNFSTQNYSLSSDQIDNNYLEFDVDFSRLNNFVLFIEKSNDRFTVKNIKDVVNNWYTHKAKSSKYLTKNLQTNVMKQPSELIAAFGTDALFTNLTDIPFSINNEYYKPIPVPKDDPLYTECNEEYYTNYPKMVDSFTQSLEGKTLEQSMNLKLGFELDYAKEYAKKWHEKNGTYFDENLDKSYIITEKLTLLTKGSVVKIEIRIDQDGKFVAPQYQGKIVIRQISIQTSDNVSHYIGSPDFLKQHT
ncbi:MAG: hypothetical protein HRT87_08760 [Legionellales bacterium]|nr:hypothetical protein [Legionellales bacterium]